MDWRLRYDPARVSIGKMSIIGAGALVNKSLPERVTAVGVPAKSSANIPRNNCYIAMILKILSIFVAYPNGQSCCLVYADFGNFYYVLIAISLALLLVLSGKHISVSFSGIILISVCAISILVNDIPDFFRPWLRLGIFSVTIFLVGPFINGSILMKFRMTVFWYVQYLFVAITLLSQWSFYRLSKSREDTGVA